MISSPTSNNSASELRVDYACGALEEVANRSSWELFGLLDASESMLFRGLSDTNTSSMDSFVWDHAENRSEWGAPSYDDLLDLPPLANCQWTEPESGADVHQACGPMCIANASTASPSSLLSPLTALSPLSSEAPSPCSARDLDSFTDASSEPSWGSGSSRSASFSDWDATHDQGAYQWPSDDSWTDADAEGENDDLEDDNDGALRAIHAAQPQLRDIVFPAAQASASHPSPTRPFQFTRTVLEQATYGESDEDDDDYAAPAAKRRRLDSDKGATAATPHRANAKANGKARRAPKRLDASPSSVSSEASVPHARHSRARPLYKKVDPKTWACLFADCGRQVHSSSGISRHVKTHRAGYRTHECPACGISIAARRDVLKKHLTRRAGKAAACKAPAGVRTAALAQVVAAERRRY
ncbi:hypothetical protein K438DRAFT_1763108 [Mycena galopus ATCC 62051]|nr:hypothetical protein K438DRAFT_1763108 [Mycena galopus ATCC 62051]